MKEIIQSLRPELLISTIQLPEGHNMNDMWLNYGAQGISELLENPTNESESKLEIINDFKIGYKGKIATYYLIGTLPMDLGNLRIALHIIEKENQKKHRLKIDLADFVNLQNQCRELNEKQGLDANLLEVDLLKLADLLDDYREQKLDEEFNPITDLYSEKELTPKAEEKAIEFLSNPKLIQNIDKLLGQSGIVGEEDNRKTLFVIASSYKMPNLLHGLVNGASGEGKSHLINAISECMPQEDVLNMTRITSKSLYHYREKELVNKLILIQDFDGLEEEAQLAFREMQSAKFLSSSTVVKDVFGNIRGKIKRVNAHFASLTATTQAEVYFDNMSRSIVLGVDESHEQTLRIIKAQNMKIAGISDKSSEEQAKQLLRNVMRVLKVHEVVNPYADKISLPIEAKMLRRLNSHFQSFITQITLLHQFQRKTDDKGRLIATKQDVEIAVEVFFNSIFLKVDELDKSTRQFFEQLKGYVKSQANGTTHRFTAKEIRDALNVSKTTSFKKIEILQKLEHIRIAEGSANRGFKFMVAHWDNLEKMKAKIKDDLNKQLKAL
jgi:hypothetical protein